MCKSKGSTKPGGAVKASSCGCWHLGAGGQARLFLFFLKMEEQRLTGVHSLAWLKGSLYQGMLPLATG